jgi:fumarate hydratase, class II
MAETSANTRIEKDSIGELAVPADAYYGVQTLRAMHNFPISGHGMPRPFIVAHATLKKAAARTNETLGLLDKKRADAIAQACDEIAAGKLADQFPVDVYQTGSGTSTNMNLNEVIASRANEILGGKRGDRAPVHPNDTVNMGQSSNDTIPTSLHIMALHQIKTILRPGLETLEKSLRAKSKETWNVIKTGRTHLQDATPIRMGQEFLGWAGQIERSLDRLTFAEAQLAEVAIGGTAVGTGINAHPKYPKSVCDFVSQWLGITIKESDNHFQSQNTLDGCVMASGVLRTIAVSLTKIANDIRWMGSGPRAGFGEIDVPAVQPGSSIMPGKVNPVIAESVLMVCQRAIGNDAAIVAAGSTGNFELIVTIPVVAQCLDESITLLGAAAKNFAEQCIDGLKPTTKGPQLVEQGLMLATALAPVIGYDAAAGLAKKASKTGQTIRELARTDTKLTEQQLTELLDPTTMVEPSDRVLPTSG